MNEQNAAAPLQNLSTSEAAKRLGVGRTGLYEMLRDGRIRALRIGRRTLVPTSEIERFVRCELEKQNGGTVNQQHVA